ERRVELSLRHWGTASTLECACKTVRMSICSNVNASLADCATKGTKTLGHNVPDASNRRSCRRHVCLSRTVWPDADEEVLERCARWWSINWSIGVAKADKPE